jgi:hypothetical protein
MSKMCRDLVSAHSLPWFKNMYFSPKDCASASLYHRSFLKITESLLEMQGFILGDDNALGLSFSEIWQ